MLPEAASSSLRLSHLPEVVSCSLRLKCDKYKKGIFAGTFLGIQATSIGKTSYKKVKQDKSKENMLKHIPSGG